MNCFSFILLSIISLANIKRDGFVTFQQEKTTLSLQGDTKMITFHFEIRKGYHIQTDKPDTNDMVNTEFSFENNPQIEIVSTSFFANYGSIKLGLYELKIISDKFSLTIAMKCTEMDNCDSIKGILLYQACDDKQCYFPRELAFEIAI